MAKFKVGDRVRVKTYEDLTNSMKTEFFVKNDEVISSEKTPIEKTNFIDKSSNIGKDFTFTQIFDYFTAPENRYRLSNITDEGFVIPHSTNGSYSQIIRFTDYLLTLLRYSKTLTIDFFKLIELMDSGTIKKLGWNNEEDFLMFIQDIINFNNPKEIPETIIAMNIKALDNQ